MFSMIFTIHFGGTRIFGGPPIYQRVFGDDDSGQISSRSSRTDHKGSPILVANRFRVPWDPGDFRENRSVGEIL